MSSLSFWQDNFRHEFAAAVTSDDFRQRVAACPTLERQHAEFLIAFEVYVVSAEAVMAQVRQIARELGGEVESSHWSHGFLAAF